MSTRRIEVLVFEACPNLEPTLESAREAITRANVPANVRVVRVESDEEAKRLRFLGSPTVRVDDVDVDPAWLERRDFGLQCRVYSIAGRYQGTPPTDWIVAALRGASTEGQRG